MPMAHENYLCPEKKQTICLQKIMVPPSYSLKSTITATQQLSNSKTINMPNK